MTDDALCAYVYKSHVLTRYFYVRLYPHGLAGVITGNESFSVVVVVVVVLGAQKPRGHSCLVWTHAVPWQACLHAVAARCGMAFVPLPSFELLGSSGFSCKTVQELIWHSGL